MKRFGERIRSLFHADILVIFVASLFLILFAVAEVWGASRGAPITPLYRTSILILICLLFYFGSLLNKQRTHSHRLLSGLFWLYFALYLYLLLNVTLLDASLGRWTLLPSAEENLREYYMEWYVNLKPFHSIYEIYIQGFIKGYVNEYYTLLNLLGNLCAFMPLAFFLPRFFKTQRRWYCLLPTVLLLICAVEGIQLLFMIGSCDIDDVILNFGGVLILFGILKIPPIRRLGERITTGSFVA